MNNFCSRELTSYEQIFEGAGLSEFQFCFMQIMILVSLFKALFIYLFILDIELFNVCILLELAKMDKTERRHAWIKRRIRTNKDIRKIIPLPWHVPYRLCIQFYKKTRYDLTVLIIRFIFLFSIHVYVEALI